MGDGGGGGGGSLSGFPVTRTGGKFVIGGGAGAAQSFSLGSQSSANAPELNTAANTNTKDIFAALALGRTYCPVTGPPASLLVMACTDSAGVTGTLATEVACRNPCPAPAMEQRESCQ